MQRAVILLVVMTLLGVGLGSWMEMGLSAVCQRYLAQTEVVRQLVKPMQRKKHCRKNAFCTLRGRENPGS